MQRPDSLTSFRSSRIRLWRRNDGLAPHGSEGSCYRIKNDPAPARVRIRRRPSRIRIRRTGSSRRESRGGLFNCYREWPSACGRDSGHSQGRPGQIDELKELKLSTVEIDLRDLGKTHVDWPTLTTAVSDSPSHVRWLYSVRAEKMIDEARNEWRSHLDDLMERYNIGEFSDHYNVSALRCYSCNAPTPVFNWSSGIWNKETPPEPRPRSVKLSYSSTVHSSYWANRCGHCDALQGDFYIFLEALEYTDDWLSQRGLSAHIPGFFDESVFIGL